MRKPCSRRAPGALVTYLLGYRAKLSQSTALVKAAGTKPLRIHADHSGKIPAPWPSVAQYCNVTWVTTDYTRENGAVCVWPGSHRFCRPVPPDLEMAHDHPEVEVLEMPKGSVIVWHGSLWHGAVPRTSAGERVTLVLPHVRDHVQAQELYWASTTPEMIERNGSRFCALMVSTRPTPGWAMARRVRWHWHRGRGRNSNDRGLLATWLNQLPKGQGIPVGPCDRLRLPGHRQRR